MLLIDKMYPAKGEMRNIMTPSNQHPRKDITILRSIDDKMVRIDHNAWKTWVVDALKHSPTTLMAELSKKAGFSMPRASLDAGLHNASNARRKVMEIKMDSPDFANLFSSADQA
jgi:hypothetical protein